MNCFNKSSKKKNSRKKVSNNKSKQSNNQSLKKVLAINNHVQGKEIQKLKIWETIFLMIHLR